jgi:hypothetical protein
LTRRALSCACGGGCPRCTSTVSSFTAFPIQRKATISSPGDPDERQADEIADTVMRMAQPEAIGFRREASPRDGATLNADLAATAAASDGTPLPGASRTYFEPRLGPTSAACACTGVRRPLGLRRAGARVLWVRTLCSARVNTRRTP